MSIITLKELAPIAVGEEAALYDLGDGIACLEFRSKSNSISGPVVNFIEETLDVHMQNFSGLVFGNQAKHYSVGANLLSFRKVIEQNESQQFHGKMSKFQNMAYRVKSYPKPIIAAPYGNVLGAGLELTLHCHKRVAHSDVRMGLVEVGVGLLPSGGGVKETALHIYSQPAQEQGHALIEGFEKLILKRKSANAQEALAMGYLNSDDTISDDLPGLIGRAKQICQTQTTSSHYEEKVVTLQGESGFQSLLRHCSALLKAGAISPYDSVIGIAIAEILTGGNCAPHAKTEHELMDGEREHFVTLTKDPRTYERISFLLEQGKLLDN